MWLATRFEVDGIRHYRTGDNPDRAYPSVTAILGKTAGEQASAKLAAWNLRNPGAREEAAQRGSAVHASCEDYVRGKAITIPSQYRPYWEGLSGHLDRYDHFIWSERPLRPDWNFCTGEDGISRIWSHKHRYCGCPDIAGVRSGMVIMADLKSSVGPYCRYFPKEDNRTLFSGYIKFNKCAIQLAAYAIAFEETLGVPIDMAQILVTTPETTQSFLLRGHELDRYRYRWLQRVAQYYQLIEAEAAAEDAQQEQPERELVAA